jgi:hypothetical protein
MGGGLYGRPRPCSMVHIVWYKPHPNGRAAIKAPTPINIHSRPYR